MSVSKGTDTNNMHDKRKKSKLKVRLNMVLRAETARILLELRARGVIRSYADGVNQAIRLFYDKIIEQDLRFARLQALQIGHEKGGLTDA